ncbi:MAG: glycoside hydrolase family 3 N-terminal domain-containing protein [Bacteroidota bacterium]|nr:glycoside hydrolase family 3 N-terminal domain-containing protein [Bacteroidota bacterium]
MKMELLLSWILLFTVGVIEAQIPVFPDKYDARIKQLINQMTLEEKVFQLPSEYPNANARLGIPNLSANECLHGIRMKQATVFPQAIAMASTWDPELIERMGNVVAKESRAFGIHHCFTPMLSVVRDVRWGRTEESFGEDPFLVGNIGAAYINGLQGRGNERFDRNHIIATAKHFVADGEPMAGGNGASMYVSEYTLQNVHLYPFRMAIENAGVGSIMPAHHLLNGIPCHGNKHIMIDILRNQYHWNGLVVSDNNDIRAMKTTFNYQPDFIAVAKKALEAGVYEELSMSQGWTDFRMFGDNLIQAVHNGQISERLVDNAVTMVLRAKFSLGLFESDIPVNEKFDLIKHPENRPSGSLSQEDAEHYEKATYVGEPRKDYKEIIYDKSHQDLALEVAHKATILLKNQNHLLPLNLSKYKKIAIIGPNAVDMRLGGYSAQPKYYVSIFEGIKKFAGSQSDVRFAKGCDIMNDSTNLIPAAVELAKQSDICILALGGSEETCRENEDADNLNLTGRQMDLVQAIYATGKPCVVILLNGRPMSIEWIAEKIPAILEGWYLGQETGTALADIIFGKVNPSGKLPITFPRNVGQVPLFYNKLQTGRPRKIFQSDPEPLFPFGYGLSYTSFAIDQIKLKDKTISPDGKTALTMTIKNTGNMDGEEVVQLYIHDLVSEFVRPLKELRGFQKVFLKAGESKTIRFEIGKKQLEYWNEKWVVEPGAFELMVGTNSVDLKKVILEVK